MLASKHCPSASDYLDYLRAKIKKKCSQDFRDWAETVIDSAVKGEWTFPELYFHNRDATLDPHWFDVVHTAVMVAIEANQVFTTGLLLRLHTHYVHFNHDTLDCSFKPRKHYDICYPLSTILDGLKHAKKQGHVEMAALLEKVSKAKGGEKWWIED